MKRVVLRRISLFLILIMLLSLTGVAEDSLSGRDAPIDANELAMDGEEITIPDIEAVPPGEIGGIDLLDDPMQSEEEAEVPAEQEFPEETGGNITAQKVVPKKLTLGVKETYTLSIKKASFKSSRASVATVSKKGVITAKKKGTAKITVMSGNKKLGTCTVTVVAAPTKVTLGMKRAAMGLKETLKLEPVIPNKSHTTFTYATKNKKIATVSVRVLSPPRRSAAPTSPLKPITVKRLRSR